MTTGPAGTPAGRASGSVAGTPGTSRKTAPKPADDEAASPATEPEPEPEPAKGRRLGGRPGWGLVAASLLVALLALVAVAVLVFARPSSDELRESALDAARTYTTSITTYDASTLESDIERVQRVATGEFRQEYDETIEQLRPQLQEQRTVAVGTVVAAGVETLEDDRASVVVAVDQNITTAGQPARTEANRLRMVLVRRGGSWLVERVERL